MAPNPKIVSIRAYTGLGEFKVYPEGQTPVIHLSPPKDDSIYCVVTVRNDGSAGECFIDWLRGLAQEALVRVNLATGQTYTWTTKKLYEGTFYERFTVRTGNPNTSPWTITDKVSFSSYPITGFEIHAYYDSTEVVASGKIVETGQTFITPAYVHVGDAAGTFTIQCTYGGQTLEQVKSVSRAQLLLVEFRFGTPPPPPNIKIEKIVLRDSVLGDFNVYPEGQTPYITFAGDRRYIVTVKNYGGDAAKVYFNCEGMVTEIKSDGLVAGASWTRTSMPIFNAEQGSFQAYVSAGYCSVQDPYCGSPTQTDRKDFMVGYQPTDTFPYPPDRWCETGLSLDEGSWCCGAGLAVDTAVKIVGNASIRYSFGAGVQSFYWYMINGVINCNQYPWLLFYIKCLNPALIGDVYVVRLTDKNGKKAETEAVLHGTDFELKVLPVGETNQLYWYMETGFDWNRVVKIEFVFNSSGAGSMWIDQLYFRIAPALMRSIFIKVVDKTTNQPLPNITCRLGDYIDSVKFTYGGYMAKTDADGNAVITGIPYEAGGASAYYVFAEDPAGKYTQRPEDDVVVNVATGDQSIQIKMTKAEIPPPPTIDIIQLLIGVVLVSAGAAYLIRKL